MWKDTCQIYLANNKKKKQKNLDKITQFFYIIKRVKRLKLKQARHIARRQYKKKIKKMS